MTAGPAVPQNASGRCLIALRLRHGRDATVRRSAGAYPAAWRETPRTGHQCRCPAACGFSAPVQTPADGASPTGCHSPAGGSGDMRTRARGRTAGQPGGRSARTRTTAACRQTCKASRRWQYAARGPRRGSPLRCRAASRARAAEGSPSGASPVRRRTCNPQRGICLRLHGARDELPYPFQEAALADHRNTVRACASELVRWTTVIQQGPTKFANDE
jgi:hypothetical protein